MPSGSKPRNPKMESLPLKTVEPTELVKKNLAGELQVVF